MKTVVIGAGPAGLMAASQMAKAGIDVIVVDAKPSVGRKFLMAGKSGLNLTKDQPLADFLQAYGTHRDWLAPMLQDFGPENMRAWAENLGQEVFVGTSKRVFPKSMKTSPLLRNWLAELRAEGVKFHTRWRWTGWQGAKLAFDTPEGGQTLAADAVVLALGGASWARLGSDGKWAEILGEMDVSLAKFQPSNMGFLCNWSKYMVPYFGMPVKPVVVLNGGTRTKGEFVITKRGVEGGVIYNVSQTLRVDAVLTLDLLPDRSIDDVITRLARPQGRNTFTNHLRKTVGLKGVKAALLRECGPLPDTPQNLAAHIKNLPLPLTGPAPMDEAISTAGGVEQSSLTPDLMLKNIPGVFCAGEMLNWDAPTGGYLLTACLATGRCAGQGATRYLKT
ncbi:MAG: TIGR03862 family flavoprotein [Paracoccaceae bacterium]